jgi:plastocyanin
LKGCDYPVKKVALIALFALMISVLAACGSSSSSGSGGNSGNSGSNSNTITMGATTFSTNSITITKGSTLTFVDDQNTGSMHILVTGTQGNFQSEAGAPDFGGANGHTFQPGQSFTTGPWNTDGTYHVTCTIHPTTMNLTVTVTG